MQFDQARNLIKKLIKRKLLFHLVIINNCNVKMFAKRTSVINMIYSGQQQFSYGKIEKGIHIPVKSMYILFTRKK